MMNKQESKYFSTAAKMDEAFLQLLGDREFDYITVKDICKLAGVNRSTFYLHYSTVGDLLEETADYIGRKFSSYFSFPKIDITRIDTLPLSELYLITPQYLEPWLTFIKENKRLFQTFLTRYHTLKIADFYEDVLHNVISPILTRYHVPREDQEYMFLFYVEGILGIVKKWLREGCDREVAEVAILITDCVRPLPPLEQA